MAVARRLRRAFAFCSISAMRLVCALANSSAPRLVISDATSTGSLAACDWQGRKARHGGVASAGSVAGAVWAAAHDVPLRPVTPLVANLEEEGAGIESTRLWRVLRRFFRFAAGAIEAERPATAEKLRRASPHWMRHSHAIHALALRESRRPLFVLRTRQRVGTDSSPRRCDREGRSMGAAKVTPAGRLLPIAQERRLHTAQGHSIGCRRSPAGEYRTGLRRSFSRYRSGGPRRREKKPAASPFSGPANRMLPA